MRVDACAWKKGSALNVTDVDPDKKIDSWSDVPHSGQAWFQVFTLLHTATSLPYSILTPLCPTPYRHLYTLGGAGRCGLYPTPYCHLCALLHTATSLPYSILPPLYPNPYCRLYTLSGAERCGLYPTPYCHLCALLHTATSLPYSILPPLYPNPYCRLYTLSGAERCGLYPTPYCHLSTLLHTAALCPTPYCRLYTLPILPPLYPVMGSWSDVPHSGQAWFQVFTLLHTATSLPYSLWPGLTAGREVPKGSIWIGSME